MLSQRIHNICNLYHLQCIFNIDSTVNIDRILYRFHASFAGDSSVYDTSTKNSRLAQTDIYFGEIPFGHLFFFFFPFWFKSMLFMHSITNP